MWPQCFWWMKKGLNTYMTSKNCSDVSVRGQSSFGMRSAHSFFKWTMNQKPPVLLGLKDTLDLLMAKSPKNLSRVQREVGSGWRTVLSRVWCFWNKIKIPSGVTCGDLIQPALWNDLCVSWEDLKLCVNMKNARRRAKQEMLAELHSWCAGKSGEKERACRGLDMHHCLSESKDKNHHVIFSVIQCLLKRCHCYRRIDYIV